MNKELSRLNLKIPTDIKEYLQAAAYFNSTPQHTVSLTEYLCELVRRDMGEHKIIWIGKDEKK